MTETGDRREELLGRIVETLLDRGISDLSLRPLAKSVGTSARLLIYHFGTKEILLSDALTRLRQQMENELRRVAPPDNTRSLEEFLLLFWRWVLRNQNVRYFRVLFEVNTLVLQGRGRNSALAKTGVMTWLSLLQREFQQIGGGRHDASGQATFVIATVNGLLHDYIATGDRKRTTKALNILIETIVKMPSGDVPPKGDIRPSGKQEERRDRTSTLP